MMPEQQNTPSANRPHDLYFEQVFKYLPIARQLLEAFLSKPLLEVLDLTTLDLSSESFLSEELRESFADLVYTCQTMGDAPARICLLLEHKSSPEGRRVYLQLAQYLRGVQEEDIRQRRRPFTLTVPVLFYHGKKPWNITPLRDQYGPLPAPLTGFVPHFDICCINLRELSDDEILALRDAVLLQRVLLAFKHAYDTDFWRKNFKNVFIFVSENLPEELVEGVLGATWHYFNSTTKFEEKEMENLIETLPPPEGKKFKSTIERLIETGEKRGLEKGLEQTLLTFLKKFPDWPDEQVASTFEVSLETVRRLREKI